MICLSASPALATNIIEAVGAERCGKPSGPYVVEFLAPEDANVEARAKVRVGGAEDLRRTTTTLSLDERDCPNARCAFSATKGRTYKLAANHAGPKFGSLCVSVTRP